MKILIDANIILDVLQDRKDFVAQSSMIWKLCETKQIEGFVSALTFANIVYILRRNLDAEGVAFVYEQLTRIFSIANLTESDLHFAAQMKWDDFEDAIQSATAKRIHADYIITRNTKDFTQSEVPAIEPSAFLDLF